MTAVTPHNYGTNALGSASISRLLINILRAAPPLRGSIASDTEMRKRSFRHSLSSRAAAVGIVPSGRGRKGAASGEGVRQAHNLDELIRLQARTADQCPVD